ncbi:hypothetical protein PS783_37070 (plasmid) [Streptomyces enissocaesilis]|nr:hypothetical protein PS783_37070 [Streptomyces enissocaesilis]
MPSRPATPTTPDLTSYDLLAPQLSGGKDSAVMMAVFMEAARAAGVEDRVISYHSSLGVLEWPPVVFDGVRYPGVSELAALQSAAFGVPADRHVEVTRTLPGPGGTRMPHSLLTEIAAYGRFPRTGSPYCRKAAKEGVVSSAWTPMVSRRSRELGRPLRILKVLGLRSDEGADRKKRPAFRTVQANSARIVDEWLPVKDRTTEAVQEWHADAPVPSCWTYDSVPGAGDWLGSSRHVDRTTGRDTRVSSTVRRAASVGSHATRMEGCAWHYRTMWSAMSKRSGCHGGAEWLRRAASCRTRYRTPTASRSNRCAGTCVTSSPKAVVSEASGATPTTCCGGGGGCGSSTSSGTR